MTQGKKKNRPKPTKPHFKRWWIIPTSTAPTEPMVFREDDPLVVLINSLAARAKGHNG